jgi:hypothetical protein
MTTAIVEQSMLEVTKMSGMAPDNRENRENIFE